MMGIDLQNFLTYAEKKVGVSMRAAARYADVYIKAYYLQEQELEKWVEEHTVLSIFFFTTADSTSSTSTTIAPSSSSSSSSFQAPPPL